MFYRLKYANMPYDKYVYSRNYMKDIHSDIIDEKIFLWNYFPSNIPREV